MRSFLSILMLTSIATAAPRTMRLDYLHTGGAGQEHFALDRVAIEGDWPGPLDRWIDQSNLGKYRFEVREKSGRVLYSRGYATIYNEWEETDEARYTQRGFSESVRFPSPANRVRVVIQRRDERGAFRDAWSVEVDPNDPLIDRSPPPAWAKVWSVMHNGEPRDKVDLLLLGDGYTAREMDKWHADARRMTETLFAQ